MKSLVALHGGEINLQSRLGEGTTVTVALPLSWTPPAVREPASNIATLTPAPRPAPVPQPHQVKKRA